ncbi:MAG: M48 family metalloprotease [Armatimonadota bacterium]
MEYGRAALKQLQEQGFLSRDPGVCNRVARIMSRLNAALTEKAFAYEAAIVNDNKINAFSVGGGYIFIFQGLLSKLNKDEELASILAHEIGHAALSHQGKTMRKERGLIIGRILVALATKTNPSSSDNLFRAAYASYSRDQEREADCFSVDLYLRAGYDRAFISSAMEVIQAVEDKRGSQYSYLSEHPRTKERIEAMRKRAAATPTSVVPANAATPIPVDLNAMVGKLPIDKTEPNEWFALTPGLTQRYQVKSGETTSSYTLKVEGALDVAQGRVHRVSANFGTGTLSFYQVAMTATKVWRRSRLNDSESPWVVEYSVGAEPFETETWSFQPMVIDAVSTPLGDYKDAVKVTAKNKLKDRSYELWFAKGLGLVKRLDTVSGITETLVQVSK